MNFNNFFLFALIIITVTALVFLLYYYKHYWLKRGKKIMEGTASDNELDVCLEQTHFLTDSELKENFKTISYFDLKNQEISGVPIKATLTKKDYIITFAPPSHVLVVGTTGSGKTTSYVNPTIQIYSELKSKPSMIISDPKGELFSMHAKSLTDKGYEVQVLDLRNPFYSVKWNPLQRPYEMFCEMLNLKNTVIKDEEQGYYKFNGNVYYDEQELSNEVMVRKQILSDAIYEDLNDIISVLCPVKNKNEPIWESGAKNLILGIAIAMLEDSENIANGMTKEKYNFYNLTKIATHTDDDCAELIKYFKGRSVLSRSIGLSKQVLDTQDKTRGSYLSTMWDKLNLFSDLSLCGLTSENEINFADLAEKPVALFLQIPDEKETRHTLAAMVILQAYKELVAKANTYSNLSLLRDVYFLLDEFGQLPKIHKLEQMITVGRSRKIWLSLVVQSYAQLNKTYDKDSSDIIKSNSNTQIFIGTTDQPTIEEFSKRCGNKQVVIRGYSFSTVKADDINSNANVKERPLIYPSELSRLNRPGNYGNSIVTVFGYMPIKSYCTPSFKCKHFELGNPPTKSRKGRYFDEEKLLYNLRERNARMVVPARRPMPRRTGGGESIKQLEAEVTAIKDILERSITADLISDEQKITLINYIDTQGYLKAKEVLEQLSEKAGIMGKDNVIATIENICRKLIVLNNQVIETKNFINYTGGIN